MLIYWVFIYNSPIGHSIGMPNVLCLLNVGCRKFQKQTAGENALHSVWEVRLIFLICNFPPYTFTTFKSIG